MAPKRGGRSESTGPTITPHASSGWSARAWATMASTWSRAMRSTAVSLGCDSRARDAIRKVRPTRDEPALPSLQRRDQCLLGEAQPVIDADHEAARVVV